MLTPKQFQLLNFICDYTGRHGYSPSFDEMKLAMGLKSKSGIYQLAESLEKRGYIKREPNKSRAIEVVKHPPKPEEGGIFVPSVINGGFRNPLQGVKTDLKSSGAIELPLYRKTALETPIEAFYVRKSVISVPVDMLSKGENFAVTVKGEGLKDAGIIDGDIAIIEKSDKADNGDIILALIDDTKITLGRYRKRRDSIALEPANADFKLRIFGDKQLKIQGKIIGLLRKYG